jgi:hypothetical protein
MLLPSNIREAISSYHAKYRNANLVPPDISEAYALFPDSQHSGLRIWPEPWPYVGRPGVYLIFGPREELLYIGKDAALGSRLGTYFQYGEARGCRIVDVAAWKHQPTYVFTVALSETFEAPSLEEFLIARVNPLQNKLWSTTGVSQPSTSLERTRDG